MEHSSSLFLVFSLICLFLRALSYSTCLSIFPHCAVHTLEKWKIYSHYNFFRQIDSLVIYSVCVNALLSRFFCQKKREMRVDYRNFHTVCSKISVKSTLFLVTTLHKTLIWRINKLIFRKNSDLVFWRLFNTVTRLFISHLVILVNLSRWGWSTLHTMGNHSYHIWKIRSHLMKISWNQLYSKNNAAFTRYLKKGP